MRTILFNGTPNQVAVADDLRASASGIIDFAKLDQLIKALPDKYRSQADSVFILPRPLYLFACRRGRKNSRRTLYGLRMKARKQCPTRAQADKLARINFGVKPFAPPMSRELIETCLGSIANSDLTEVFPGRRRKDRWMGDPDLFACCSGRGFHVTRAGQIYCPCAAGFLRADLDRNTL